MTKVPDDGWFPLVIDRETSEMIGAVPRATAGEVHRFQACARQERPQR